MGPLTGLRVIELAGIGPAPFTAMMLADMGADVVRIDRSIGSTLFGPHVERELTGRGRRSVVADLKSDEGRELVLAMVERADVLIEGFRPGVTERLGVGPDVCLARNQRLVYGRMTGFGQSGPLAHAAGHDINYIALAGALGMIGRAGQPPTPPLNLVGDYGGGGLMLAFGVVCAVFEARTSGIGQVVDAAMVDGAALLMTPFFAGGRVAQQERGTSMIDSGAPFYDAYETSDGRWIAVGAVEPQFYAELLARIGLDEAELGGQMDLERWPAAKARLAEVFATRTRDEWCEMLEGTDSCFAPVLDLNEVDHHPHLEARQTFVEVDGLVQPAPAPRFSRTPGAIARHPPALGEGADEALSEWDVDADAVKMWRATNS